MADLAQTTMNQPVNQQAVGQQPGPTQPATSPAVTALGAEKKGSKRGRLTQLLSGLGGSSETLGG